MAKRYKKSKKQRQQWWNNLTSDEQQEYIESKQTEKAINRKNRPEKALKHNPTYPWMTEGVNNENREQWKVMIRKKNPWLKVA